MPTDFWQGLAPPRALAGALRQDDVQIDRAGAGEDEPLVVFTATSRRMPVPDVDGGVGFGCRRRTLARPADGKPSCVAHTTSSRCATAMPAVSSWRASKSCRYGSRHPLPVRRPSSKARLSRRLMRQVARVATTSMAVLLTGETGTGKEVLARLIHASSPRREKRFVPINCAAIPNELMEAELFGYARGAFSGAVQRYDGQLLAAEGGTVFLDEIDETPAGIAGQASAGARGSGGQPPRGERMARGGLSDSGRNQPRFAAPHRCGLVRRRPLRAPRNRLDPRPATS